MKSIFVLTLVAILTGCVSGTPRLTPAQLASIPKIEVYKIGEQPSYEYSELNKFSGADCSGPGGSRLYGDEGKAMTVLLAKAASVNATAVVNVSCGVAPLLNNCWAAKKCDGVAVTKQN